MAKQMVIVISTGNSYSEIERELGFTENEWDALSIEEQETEIQHAINNAVEWDLKTIN